jgi:hypothetical protein
MSAALALLIGRPLLILAIAGGWGLAAKALTRNRRPLLVNALAWLAFAIWEGLILVFTPEANIRVDLLLIGPLLAGLGLWALVALLWRLRR